jgi:hypothetical protein
MTLKTRKSRRNQQLLLKAFVWVFLGVFIVSAVGVAMILVAPHN